MRVPHTATTAPTPGDVLALDITVDYAAFRLAVKVQLPLRGITAVFGPSGGGKSTLLRAIAGLEPARGVVRLGSRVLLDRNTTVALPPHRRELGYAFQDARLFPHLDVRANLDFAWSRARPPTALQGRWQEVVDAFALAPLLDRRPQTLSGGERQRVSLARTLLTLPALLLLDEPLSALDSARKRQILPCVEAMATHFGVPVLYVTHSIDEVARLADRVLVLEQGRVQAFGDTADILERLDLQPLTGRFEAGVVIDAVVAEHVPQYALTRLDLGGQSMVMPSIEHLQPKQSVRLRVRARDVALAIERPQGISIRNILRGTLLSVHADEESPFAEALVALGSQRVRARITRAAVAELDLHQGRPVFVLLKSVSFDGRNR
jgi:molybdate transport system ATP-binding protein